MQSATQNGNVRMLRRPVNGQTSSGRRLKAGWPAKLRAGDVTLACTVSDISSPGANILVDNLPHTADSVTLLLPGLSPISASLVWRTRQRAGVAFETEQTWVLDNCRRRFDAAAWIETRSAEMRH